MDWIFGVVASVVFAVTMYMTYVFGEAHGKEYIADHCQNYGKVQIFQEWYTCHPERSQAKR